MVISNKTKQIILAGILVGVIAIPMIIGSINSSQVKTKEENTDKQIYQKYYELRDDSRNLYEMREFINKNGHSFSLEEADVIIDDYLYILKDRANSLTYYIDYMYYDLSEYEDIDLSKEYMNIKNDAIKGIFIEAKNLGISVYKYGEVYNFYVDAQSVINNLRISLSEEYKDGLDLVADIPYDEIKDADMNKFNTLLMDKVLMSYELEKKYPNSKDPEFYKVSRVNFLSILFGDSRTDCYKDIEKEILSDEFMLSIKGIVEKIENKELKNNLSNIIKDIEDNNNTLNEEIKSKIISLQ